MNSRICICCGEAMTERGNVLSRNPNVCASCSSMADGMDESSPTECGEGAPGHPVAREPGPQNEVWPASLASVSKWENLQQLLAKSKH